MFQFYYVEKKNNQVPAYHLNIHDYIRIEAVKPAVWEEHCLECSAPECYTMCANYEPRKDGRCKRMYNGIEVRPEPKGCCGKAGHLKFKKWSNLLMVVNPPMLSQKDYDTVYAAYDRLGNRLSHVINSRLPQIFKWEIVRSLEYCRRTRLQHMKGNCKTPNAFLFHGFSYSDDSFRLIMEVYADKNPIYKKSIRINPGENLFIIGRNQLEPCCWKNGNIVKIYPEGDNEAELDILWMDFVRGKIKKNKDEKIKCVVWDLDNTVWDGVLTEMNDISSIKVKEDVITFIKYLDERGIIQSVASKNDNEQVWPVIKRLGLDEYFLYPQISWEPKSISIQNIAEALNIGLDTFALIDDMAFEREQVHQALPHVRVYDPEMISQLYSLPEFEVVVTEESRNRRLMYQAEEMREKVRNTENAGIEDFLKASKMSVDVFVPHSEEEYMRCFELLVRTNQLNMTGHKYSHEEFYESIGKNDKNILCFSCEDIYGTYGIVGYCQYRMKDDVLTFTEFTMSCRVAGKYVESAFFESLLKKAKSKKGVFPLIKSTKNGRLMKTLEEIGFNVMSEDERIKKYAFSEGLKNSGIVKVIYRNI